MGKLLLQRGWLWYFFVVAVLTGLAIGVLIVFNLGQQLQPEEVREARRRWQQRGLRSYRLAYTMKKDRQPPDHVVVRVRQEKVILVTQNGKEEPAAQWPQFGMDRLLDAILEDLERAAGSKQRRPYLRAQFDPDDGRLRWYVRSHRGGPRQEIHVESLQRWEGD